MPLDEYCLPSSNILSNHCPDVLIYSIQIESEYHERKEDTNILGINRKGRTVLSHRPQLIFLAARLA